LSKSVFLEIFGAPEAAFYILHISVAYFYEVCSTAQACDEQKDCFRNPSTGAVNLHGKNLSTAGPVVSSRLSETVVKAYIVQKDCQARKQGGCHASCWMEEADKG